MRLTFGARAIGSRWAASIPLACFAFATGLPGDAAASPLRHSERSRCAGGRTVSASSRARVYKQGGAYYGCAYAAGRRVRLNSDSATYGFIWRDLEGAMFAFALRHFGLAPQEVVVRDLRTGRVVHRHAVNQRGDYADMVFAVQRLLVTPSGSVAWLACSTIETTDSFCKRLELHAIGHDNRHRLLDQGDPKAFSGVRFRAKGSRVSWNYAGMSRSSPLH